MKQPKTSTLATLLRTQHSHDSSLCPGNMTEPDIHDCSLHLERMFEPTVIIGEFVNHSGMHDKAIHRSILLPLRVITLATLFYSPTFVATGRYVPLHWKKYIHIVNTALNQCNVQTAMLIHFSCFLLIHGESC